MTTETPRELRLVDLIAEAMNEADKVTKSSQNKDQNYKFASAEAILAAVRGPLLKRGVILTAEVTGSEASPITSRNGAQGTVITIDVTFTFRGAGEELVIAGWQGQGQDYGDKALGKAYTNALKTFIRTQWLLPTEHDDPEGSDPGERVAPSLPTWALEASDERKTEWIEVLSPLVGLDAAATLGINLEGKWGHMPDGAVAIVKALAPLLTPPPAAPEVEQPEEPQLDDRPAPGTVPMPELPKDPAKAVGTLGAAGCTCDDPLGIRGTPKINETCPIVGHGIPF